MILVSTAPRVRIWQLMRFGLLALVGLLLGHEAVYATEYGLGQRLAMAMAASGHDGYWSLFTAAAAGAVLVLAAHASVRLLATARGLADESAEEPALDRPPGSRGSSPYLAELRVVWPPLFLFVAVAFAIQENVERLLSTGVLTGLGVVGSNPLVLPILALVTGVLAALGAAVRWRVGALEARLRAARCRRAWRARPAAPPHPRWTIDGAARAARWLLLRPDPGRAPPV